MGTLDLTGQTLAASRGTWVLAGGTIKGGTIANTVVNSDQSTSTLDSVTVTGTLTLAGTSSSFTYPCIVNVVGSGLILNGGTVNLGYRSTLAFTGLQTLGATSFVNQALTTPNPSTDPANTGVVNLDSGGTVSFAGTGKTLTIGAKVHVHGGSGSIDAGSNAFINQGTISEDTSTPPFDTFTLNGTNWKNQGTIEVPVAGQTINLTGSWTNTANLNANAGTLSLGGTWTNTGSLAITNNGTVVLGGSLTQSL